MTVVTLVGARPQFIKASMVSRAFEQAGIKEVILHSGQHYDRQVSQIFFDELEIPQPEINLHVGSGSHAVQTGEIMERFESFLLTQDAVDWVLVYGDTNTTLAGALVAAKLDIPVAHVEAGLRSFNRKMPEEINRIVTDRLSEVLFCPTDTAMQHVRDEGITTTVCFSGDVMYDATMHFSKLAARKQNLSEHLPATYYLATVHRASNTDNRNRLSEIFDRTGCFAGACVAAVASSDQSQTCRHYCARQCADPGACWLFGNAATHQTCSGGTDRFRWFAKRSVLAGETLYYAAGGDRVGRDA